MEGAATGVIEADPIADPATLRRVFGRVPSAVVAVAAMVGDAPVGFAASTLVPVSLDPALVAFCIQSTSTTWPLLGAARRLGVSVLSDHHGDAARRLAGPAAHRFTDLSWTATADGAILLDEAGTALECSVEQTHRAGDHDIVVLRVHAVSEIDGPTPLIFHASSFHGLGRSS